MNDDDAREYRVRLAQFLRSKSFDWIVNQVQAVISAGKQFDKEIELSSFGEVDEEEISVEGEYLHPKRGRRTKRSSTLTASLSPPDRTCCPEFVIFPIVDVNLGSQRLSPPER